MNLQSEQIIREVLPIGNGAHVFAPKEWMGEEVFLVRAIKTELKERIIEAVSPYLEDVLGVYLYGSYARGEERQDSDIDILIITDKKLKIKKNKLDVISLTKDSIPDAIKISPVLIYSALTEAKPIINSSLLDEIKIKYKPSLKDFKEYLIETKEIIKINESLLDHYSIILRLRGVYIIKIILSGESYSNAKFKQWVLKKIPDLDFDSLYKAYNKTKKGLKSKKPEEKFLKSLLDLLNTETNELCRK